MRYLLCTIFVGLVLFSAKADETLFRSGFEKDFLEEWGETNPTTMPTFERSADAKYTGEMGCRMIFDGTSQKGNLTTSHDINWESGEIFRISFWYKGINPSDNGDTNMKFFTGRGAKIHQINISDWNSTEWKQYSVEFNCVDSDDSGYILFSFRPRNDGAGEYYLDDFLIEKVVPEASYWTNLKTKNVTSDSTIQWVQFGPGMSGNNKCAAWHPTDPNVLFIGPNMGNSYASWDKGKTYETILNEDETDFKQGNRGPIEVMDVDFSHQSADFGMCCDERNQGIYYTEDRGHYWQSLNTTTFNGKYVDCLCVDPKDDQVWYAGGGRLRNLGSNLYPNSAPKGILAHAESLNKIWKSTNKGKTWELKNSGLEPETGIETLLVDPKNSNIVYASTSTGFYKSIDAGENWTKKISGMDYDMLRSMDYHYNEADDVLTIMVISNPMWKASGSTITNDKGGIFKSVDRGESWTKVEGNLPLDMRPFQSNYDIKKSFWHAAAYTFDMTDEDFQTQYPDLPSKITIRYNTIEIDPTDVNNIYLNNEYSNSSRNNFKPGQVWRSKDGGVNWHVCLRNGKGWNAGSSDYNYWVNRGNPMETNISLRYLEEWENRDLYDRKGCNFVKFNSDGTVLHTQMAKISLFSYDKGETWVDIDDEFTTEGTKSIVGAGNSNVPGHGFFQHPDMKNKVYCMAGENQLNITNNEGDKVREGAQAATSIRILEDEASLSWYAINPLDTMKHYALFFRQAKKGQFYMSNDYGESWFQQGVAVPYWDITGHSGDQSVHQNHLTIDPVDPNFMYFVVSPKSRDLGFVGHSVTAFGLHKTSDGGKNWKESNVGLPESKDATMVAIDPNNHNTVYVTIQNSNGGLFKSVNNGESWGEVESTKAISGNYGVNDIHFARDGKVYITAGTKNGNADDGGVWVSNDSLKTWMKIFDYPWTHRIETAWYDPQTILVSTLPNSTIKTRNAGTYHSKDGGETWTKINIGNGQSDRINDIAIDNHNPGKYYASTYGSGWYTAQDHSPNEPTPIEGMSFLQDTIFLNIGSDTIVSPIISPEYAYNQKLNWLSENTQLATVDSKGVVKGLAKGVVTITAKDESGDVTSNVIVKVIDLNNINRIGESNILVFPNPASHIINVEGISNFDYEIIGLKGRVLASAKNKSATIDVSSLDAGFYVLLLRKENAQYRRSIILN